MEFCIRTHSRHHLLDRMEHFLQHLLIKVPRPVASPQVLDKVLHCHGNVEFLRVVIVLIHVEHDHCVRETERGVCIREWFAIV